MHAVGARRAAATIAAPWRRVTLQRRCRARRLHTLDCIGPSTARDARPAPERDPGLPRAAADRPAVVLQARTGPATGKMMFEVSATARLGASARASTRECGWSCEEAHAQVIPQGSDGTAPTWPVPHRSARYPQGSRGRSAPAWSNEESAALKIAVCVKEVPDATAPKRIDPGTKKLDRSGEKTMNPYDAHALEEAVRLKEGAAGADSLITALCMGPEGALRTLHKALSLGADEALLVTDPALEGADIATTARVLAAAAKHLGADLVLLGQQAVRLRLLRDGRGRRRAPAAAARDAGRRARADGRRRARQAPVRDRLRRRRGAAARGDLGLRRDQRAALCVAQGDHGRAQEAAEASSRSPISAWRRDAAPRCSS